MGWSGGSTSVRPVEAANTSSASICIRMLFHPPTSGSNVTYLGSGPGPNGERYDKSDGNGRQYCTNFPSGHVNSWLEDVSSSWFASSCRGCSASACCRALPSNMRWYVLFKKSPTKRASHISQLRHDAVISALRLQHIVHATAKTAVTAPPLSSHYMYHDRRAHTRETGTTWTSQYHSTSLR